MKGGGGRANSILDMHAFTPSPHLDTLLDLALAEDIGCGDYTGALVPSDAVARIELIAREALVFCGAPVAERLLWRYGPGAPTVSWQVQEGEQVVAGTVVGHLEGALRAGLVVERPLLNFLQRLSGVATLTRRYVDAISGTRARLVDTRKTMPGHRMLDKYAVRCGGGFNHRAALDGGVLIKDNHLLAAGGVAAAVRKARAIAPHSLRIEVEVESLPELSAALDAGADVVLLDNFTPEQVAEAVAMGRGKALMEASGGIDLTTVRAFAEAGVDLIAIGALTHSAIAVDLAAEVVRA